MRETVPGTVSSTDEHQVGRKQTTRTQGFGDLDGSRVILIEGVGESDPIDRVREEAFHSV